MQNNIILILKNSLVKISFWKKQTISLLIFCLLFLPFSSLNADSENLIDNHNNIYIIKLKKSADLKKVEKISNKSEQLFRFSKNEEFENVYRIFSDFTETEIKNYLKNDLVYLNKDKFVKLQDLSSSDPGFTSNPVDIDKQWGLAKTGFPGAWVKTTGSHENIVAIIDSGIDATHEDLRNVRFVPGYDFVSKQGISGNINSDLNGHGTLIAGILGATANNRIGISGTNWQLTIMPVRVLDEQGKGDISNVAQAIVWAADHNALFINLSFGGAAYGYDPALSSAIAYAFSKGSLIVAASGNDTNQKGVNLDLEPIFPICEDNDLNMVIGVVATDQNDIKTEFSNFGKNCIDVAAPGKRILSTINYDPFTKKMTPNSYAYASGSSVAVPFVVGQAMLIKSLNPSATNVQIRDRILSTAENIDNLNLAHCQEKSCKGLLGFGRINVFSSIIKPLMEEYSEGQLVKEQSGSTIYQIIGGQKRPVSPFVFNQKFLGQNVQVISSLDLNNIPEGSYATPKDDTLIKHENLKTVYIFSKGKKLPITYEIFLQHGFSFENVKVLSFSEIESWVTGNFLPPKEGSLVKGKNSNVVYWSIGQVLHPVNKNFYKEQGLSIFPLLVLPDEDLLSFAKGEPYFK